jgi:hypothetical protein
VSKAKTAPTRRDPKKSGAAPKKSGRASSQQTIEVTRSKRDAGIEELADEVDEAFQERTAWSTVEREKRAELAQMMKKKGHGAHYETDEYVVSLEVADPTEKVKVKKRKLVEAAE